MDRTPPVSSWSAASKEASLLHSRWLWSLLAITPPLVIYFLTVAPTVYWLDAAELTTGAYTLGIVHAPGSPLYLLLGYAFTWLPFGDIGYRVNLMSVVTSSLTVLFTYLIVYDLTRQRLLALATAWFVAFSFYVWITAVAAELYSLQGAFVTGLLLLAMKWREQQRPWQLCLLAFLFGLGTGNHLSLVLMLPGFALLALATPLPWRRPRWLFIATVCGLLGGAIYLYLPLRYLADPALNYAGDYWDVDLATWSGFWWMVTGRMFDSIFFSEPLHALPREIITYGAYLWSNFIGLGSILALWGVISDFRKRTIFHVSLLLMFIAHLTFYIPYGAPDQVTMLLPTYLIWGVWLGLGVHSLSQRFPFGVASIPNGTVWPFLLLLLAFSSLVINYRYADISDDWSARERGEQIFAALEPEGLFLGSWIDVPILEYLQIVESQRPDVQLVNFVFTSEEQRLQMVVNALSAGISVYTTLPGFPHHPAFTQSYSETCDCFEVRYHRDSSKAIN